MSVDRWNTVLVLGGIRSGKSAFAESLVADAASVRYIATAAGAPDDPEWNARIEAHRRRRPASWYTEETATDPARLAVLLADAKPGDMLLVDDLGGWVAALLDPARRSDPAAHEDSAPTGTPVAAAGTAVPSATGDVVASATGDAVVALADAVRECEARVVFVSPEVGLSLVPTNPVGRAFTDSLGAANQAVAAACDAVVLVIAGQPTWLKPTGPEVAALSTAPALAAAAAPGTTATAPTAPATTATAPTAPDTTATTTPAPTAPTAATTPLPAPTIAPVPVDVVTAETPAGSVPDIEPGMDLPLPDNDAGPDARDRLETLDLPGSGLGALGEAVEFAAAAQGTTVPRPWGPVRLLLLAGEHTGDAAAGADPDDADRRVAAATDGSGPLARLAAGADADIQVVRVAAAGAMEDGPVLDADGVEAALRQGWALAEQAADDGRDALVLGACGTGTEAAATAVMAASTGAEPVAVLPRVLVPGGRYDDEAWMRRCAAVRDALHRIRREPRGARDILSQLGGADVAVATGVLLGAAARRLPVLLDGPVGIAAGLVARDLAAQTRHWCLLAEAGTLALVKQGADVLGLTPVLQLGLDLGEGANALAALPLLRSAIGLTESLGVHPALLDSPGDPGWEDADFVEPEPDGPGPARAPGA
ncbi:adenosylcobinamide kinase /adenosylcobinamide-phosphate guanylyltransferase [Krasilnikovia cinnamomea]|uniref:Adenosylcobinamide kinase n=1 Tax=Krasilnikovia cinnamomea TaxID=349313 RepID=A0A4Q7ZP61_9ACTN|nr:bifunctional adenosylcobinamide kinase/adenosylcobinamide-phosphate guanylyltransferase [Krasilnikovia cinnamomea]RZU52842.1 adenosylcobinamide kinase /adenosylcobinamide-phosphate guanylyltransferase [Krasilnikovia cinnamomea]